MVEFQEKDWVNHIIIASGIIVGIFIIIGFISEINYFKGPRATSTTTIQDESCTNCLSEDDNNFQQTIKTSSRITLELSATLYDRESLVVQESPQGIAKETGNVEASSKGRWAVQFETLASGYVDITVKSNLSDVPDYHTLLVVE